MFFANIGPHLSQPANWSCPRTAPYEPILAIPVEALRINPAWANCLGGINGAYDPPVALTPKGAIAKPTLAEEIPETTSEAVPASALRPTLATVTPVVELSKVSVQSPTSNVQESRPDSPVLNGSPTVPDANDEQTDKRGPPPGERTTTSTRKSRSIAPAVDGHPAQVFEGPEIRPTEHSVPNILKSKVHDPNGRSKYHDTEATPKSQIDTLSILLEAQSSIDAATRQQGHAQQTHSPGLPATRTEPAETFKRLSDIMTLSAPRDPVDVTMASGNSVTRIGANNPVVLQHDGSLFTTAAPGSILSVNTHVFSAASDGGAITIDHSVTHSMPSSNVQRPALATFEAGDDTITVYRQGSVVGLADGTQTLTAQLGGAVTINSHSIDIATDGHALIVGSSTVDISSNSELEGSVSAAVQTAGEPASMAAATRLLQDDEELVDSAAESGIVVQQGTSKVTLAAGQETTFNGHTLSAVQSGAVLILDGNLMTITQTDLTDESSKKVDTTSDGRSASPADAAGATDTVEVVTSRLSTPKPSNIPGNAAVGSAVNTSLFMVLLCLISCVWAGVVSVYHQCRCVLELSILTQLFLASGKCCFLLPSKLSLSCWI